MSPAEASLADLIELAETIEGRANHHRSLTKARIAAVRHYHEGKADAHDSDARLIREIIAERQSKERPALRLVPRETVDQSFSSFTGEN